MSEQQPATERRGGIRPDWKHVKPGEDVPELEDPAALPEPLPGPSGQPE